MGLEKLSAGARSALLEIGRMAYGSREGAKGGKGHIGLLNADGKMRVIKFDTHGGSTGGDNAVRSGNDLRNLLVTISRGAGLSKETLNEIRQTLGLPSNDSPEAAPPPDVLDRTITAKVVELIGGKEIWQEVEASFSKDEYKSRGDTSFENVANQPVGNDTNNVKTIEKVETVTAEALKSRFEDLERLLGTLAGECPEMNLAAARRLLRRALTDGDAINAMLVNLGSLKAVTEDDLDKALLKMLVNVAVANRGNADADKLLKVLNDSLEGGGLQLTSAYRASVKLNAGLIDWCGKNAAEFGVENADDMKAAVLQRLFEQDLRGVSADYTVVTEKITFGGRTVEVKGTKNGLDALKAALGIDQPKKGAFTLHSGPERAANFRQEFDRTRVVERNGAKHQDDVYPAYRKFLKPQRIRNTADLAQKITDKCMTDFNERYAAQTLAREHGFEDEFLMEMASAGKVGSYTIDGKPVPTSRLVRPQSLPLDDPGAIQAKTSNYLVKTAEGSARDVSADSLAFMAAVEKLVPDARMRFLLTMIIGRNEPVSGLLKDNPEAFGISKRDAENLLAAQTETGCKVTELFDASTRRFDLSVEHGQDGDYAVVKEYVNVSPTFGSIGGVRADSTNGGAGISLAENWVEVTFRIRMGGEAAHGLLIEENAAPTLTTSVRQLGVDPLAKREALANIRQFVAEAKAHGSQAGYYLKLSEDGIGLTSAGSRNILRGSVSRTENNEVRARLKNLITTYYGSKYAIPPLVQQAMTNFTGEGNPLSAERVDKIWRAMEVDRVLSMSPEEFMKDPEAAFVLADNGGSLLIPDEWRQDLKAQGYDLSEKAVAKGLKTRAETIRNTAITLNVSGGLAEMVKSGDLVQSGKLWVKDVARSPAIRIGDTVFNANAYCEQRLELLKSGSVATSAEKAQAEYDTALEVTNRLVQFISKGKYAGVEELKDSQDEKMKKLLFFVKAHMAQDSIIQISNDAFKGLNPTRMSSQAFAYGVQFGADGGIVFSHGIVQDFSTLEYVTEAGDIESCNVDLEEGRYCKAIKMTYSKGQLDGVLDSDFNDYAAKYEQFNPNEKLTAEERAEKDEDLVRKNRVDRFNGEIDPKMILRPEVKTACTITAVEQPDDPDALEAEDRIRKKDSTEGRIVSYLADKLNIQRAGEEDMNLAITDPAKVDGSGDLNHACRKKAFSYETGSSSTVADKVAAKHPDERIGVQIYGDGTYAHCGFVANTNGQEEDTAHDLHPKGMAHLLAKKFVRKCARIKDGSKYLYFKYLKGKDGGPLLSTARGYMMDGELVRKDNKDRDKALSVDLLYSAMPSLTSASTSFDLQSNIEHLRMCRERLTGTKLTPQQLENATRFLEEFYRPRQAEPKQEDGLTDKEFEAAMKLLIFSGETPAFDVFGANAAKEVQKLRNLVKVSTRTDESGDAALYDDLMKTAEKNYRASIRRTIRGWIVSARERGVKHFISGAMGCGFFKNDPAVVSQIVAEEFVDHGGDMEFVFAQYNAKEPNVGLRNAFEKAFDKAWETREARHKQLQQGIEPEDVSVTETA